MLFQKLAQNRVISVSISDFGSGHFQMPNSKKSETFAKKCCHFCGTAVLVLCDFYTHLLCSAKPWSLPGLPSTTSDRLCWQRGRGGGSVLGYLSLVFWFKQFPAVWDMIETMKCLGNIAILPTLHMLPAATQRHPVIKDMNLGARVGAKHLNLLAFVSLHQIFCSTGDV